MANNSNFTPYYIAETTFGTTPSPIDGVPDSWLPLPQSGFSLSLTRENVDSNNIKSGRYKAAPILGTATAGGEHNADLVYGDFDDYLEAVMCGTWSAGVLKAGETKRSFSVAGFQSDLGGTNKHTVFRGVSVNTMNLSCSVDSPATVGFGLIAKSEDNEDRSADTFASDSGNDVFDTYQGSIKIDNVASSIATEVSITLDNGMEPRKTVFTGTETGQPDLSVSELTGNLTVFFDDVTLRDKYLNSTNISLEFTLTNAQGSYTFLMPKVRLTGGTPDRSGSSDITLPLTFEAIKDDVEGTHLKITKV